MKNDVVCAENELSKASNAFEEYADFLCRKIDEYIDIIDYIQQSNAIKDQLICSKLTELTNRAGVYKAILGSTTSSITKNMRKYVERIQEEDTFSFPDDFSILINGLAAQFKS